MALAPAVTAAYPSARVTTPSRGTSRRLEAWAFAWFFSLLAGYFLLRPVREAIGVRGGENRLSWLYTGTFVAMLVANPLYAWAVGKVRRNTLVPTLYVFFASHLVAFCVAFAVLEERGRGIAGDVFFVWLSVFNLSAVTTFWGVLADVFDRENAKRRFGLIGAGGTLGAITGSFVADLASKQLGFVGLLALATGLLVVAAFCALRLLRIAPVREREAQTVVGSPWHGWRDALGSPYLRSICLYLLLFTITSTFVYYEQRELVGKAIHSDAERTSYFAGINLWSNVIALCLQSVVTARLIRFLGLGKALAGVPVICAIGFGALGASPALLVISTFEVLRRTAHFALSKPAQEVLFTTVARDQKYRAKSFIDTVVYRGGDVAAAWSYSWLAQGFGFVPTTLCGLGLAVVWLPLALRLGRRSDSAHH